MKDFFYAQLIRNLGWGVLVYVAFMEGDGMYFLGNSDLEIGWGVLCYVLPYKELQRSLPGSIFWFSFMQVLHHKERNAQRKKAPPRWGTRSERLWSGGDQGGAREQKVATRASRWRRGRQGDLPCQKQKRSQAGDHVGRQRCARPP